MKDETGSIAGEFLRSYELFGLFNRGGGAKKLYPVTF